MRINEYDSIDQFIYEYKDDPAFSTDDEHPRKYMGIEFRYHGVYYRMCREPNPYDKNKHRPMPSNGKIGHYEVTIMHCNKKGYPIADTFESIGWYGDIDDLLNHCIIDGKTFKDVIMADETKILSQD